ncbi:D-alanine--D-alanine ligase [Pseudocolwellia sp. AS88]|uniref:D-alanine--D-alanine ligase n=1 Tax=Pseudocolwellia sp. AS88 TaxID=3063958 RepID=UPI0026F068DA|nr:D-alanine--D-alanine ligase [Pseudocolwellia sp. AS88]MDO7084982.1 D-alanine--D-alanine ligase [Pseudocolwellia sp. AS88]
MSKVLKEQKIAVLYGGNSAEREVSLRSGNAIFNALVSSGFNAELIDTKGFCLSELTSKNIDRVFIALHGRGGEDGCLQGALEYMNIPYTGSDVLGSALSMDKIRSKQVFQAVNIPTAPFCIAVKSTYEAADATKMMSELGHKVMVKPANEGSSIGMAMATNAEQLHDALTSAFEYDEDVLVEAWITGPEYTVAILGNEALPAIHMETPNEFYDYQAKYQSTTTQYHCPCGLPAEDEQQLQAIALSAFKATGAKGWGRVDVMRSEVNGWQVLEVNTVPGMTETSLVPKAAKEYGLAFDELVSKVLEISL